MKKILKMTLFKKIFLIVFSGFLIIEGIHIQLDYQSYIRSVIWNSVNHPIAEKLHELAEKEDVSQEECIDFIKKEFENQKKDYYVAVVHCENNNQRDIVYESMDSYAFDDEPHMIVISKEEDDIQKYIDLKALSKDSLEHIENVIKCSDLNETISIWYQGEEESFYNEETESTYLRIIPSALRVNNDIVIGEKGSYHESLLHIYSSSQMFYRDYQSQVEGKALLIEKDVHLNDFRNAALTFYDDLGAIGLTRLDYRIKNTDVMISHRIDFEDRYIIYLNDCHAVLAYAFDNAIASKMHVYILAVFLSLLMSFFISYTMSRRIKRIHQATDRMSQQHFDIQLEEKSNDELGELSHHINVMSTRLKETIDELNQEIEQVKRLENIRKEFIANFTHEIKTPLSIINGYIELIEETQDNEKKEKYLAAIEMEADHINELVLAMLNLSRLEAGKVELHKEDINMEEVITTVIDSLSALLQKKK